jgi:hypothetical protein
MRHTLLFTHHARTTAVTLQSAIIASCTLSCGNINGAVANRAEETVNPCEYLPSVTPSRLIVAGRHVRTTCMRSHFCFYGPLSDTKGLQFDGTVPSREYPWYIGWLELYPEVRRGCCTRTPPPVSLRYPTSVAYIHVRRPVGQTAFGSSTELDTGCERLVSEDGEAVHGPEA